MMSAFTYEQGVPSERSHQSRLPGPRSRSAGPLAVGLPQHPDQHRPERPIILAVDQRWAKSYGSAGPPELADSLDPADVGRMRTSSSSARGAGSRALEALAEPAL